MVQEEKSKKIGTLSLILMIFTSLFGLSNTTIAYDQMGYAAIVWYVLGALLFFLPSGLMFAEYGSTFKSAKGGIYSWLEGSIGEKPAFIGTFIWLSGWIIWLVSEASRMWIPFATAFAGYDTTQSWHLFGLSSTQTIGVIAIVAILVITYFSSRGVDQFAKFTNFSGVFTLFLTAVFMLASLFLIIIHHGHLAQPFTAQSLIHSPNPQFQSPVALLSFISYAIFAYAGMETMSGVIDNVKDAEHTFPKALIIATLFILTIYSVGIFLWGISANWKHLLGKSTTDLGNVLFVLMNNLGYSIGIGLHFSNAAAVSLGNWFGRLIGIEEFLADTGALFVMIYSPLKSFILGTPKKFWPKKLTELNKDGVPAHAMWLQAIIVDIILFGVSFGGKNMQNFYTVLTDMGNVSNSLPYLFLIAAFPFFKAKKNLARPFVAYHSKTAVWTITAVSWLTILIGIIFTILDPIMTHDYSTAFWTIIGPIFFGTVAWAFYSYSQHHVHEEEETKISSQND